MFSWNKKHFNKINCHFKNNSNIRNKFFINNTIIITISINLIVSSIINTNILCWLYSKNFCYIFLFLWVIINLMSSHAIVMKFLSLIKCRLGVRMMKIVIERKMLVIILRVNELLILLFFILMMILLFDIKNYIFQSL